jgi:hypothetical protein
MVEYIEYLAAQNSRGEITASTDGRIKIE